MSRSAGARRLSRISRVANALGGVYRAAVTRGRWAVVVFWVAAAVGVNVLAPGGSGTGGGFGDLVSPDSEVLQVEQRILADFRVPILSTTTVVLHQPGGLTPLTRADSVLWALATTQAVVDAPNPPVPGQIVAAIPVPTGRTDTMVTYLYTSDGTGLNNTVRLANEYAAHFNNQPTARAYVTGFVPAQVAQGHYLRSRLTLFEIASLLLIVAVVAVAFRSLLAPVVVVGIAGVGYLVYFRLLSRLAELLEFEVPTQLEPLLVALLLGVVTDYCVLLFTDLRHELEDGLDRHGAAREALHRNGAVVAVAGLTVAGGTLALVAAPFAIFRGLGPALALTVLVGLALCLTLTPALMAIFGWRLFTVLPVRGSGVAPHPVLEGANVQAVRRQAGLGLRLLTRRGWAGVAVVIVLGLLVIGSLPLGGVRLSLSFTSGLPRADEVRQGAALLSDARIEGISAPTEVLVEQAGVVGQRPALNRLEQLIAAEPGVVRVLGPADLPFKNPEGLVLARSGNAARYVVIYDTDPLASAAISHARQLKADLPTLAREAGLPDAYVAVTGQSLIASEVATLTRDSLAATLLVAVVVELLILVLYLRALVAPLVLLACSVLSVAAALGVTTYVFQDSMGVQGLTFYAPFSAAVLLIALGSDYNVFAVGSIWREARHRPLAEALLAAVPRTSRAITTAGLILAATFAMVAIIPLATFRQIALAMTVGLLLDTLLVRPVLTPAVLTLLGRRASWPSRRITTARNAPDRAEEGSRG